MIDPKRIAALSARESSWTEAERAAWAAHEKESRERRNQQIAYLIGKPGTP